MQGLQDSSISSGIAGDHVLSGSLFPADALSRARSTSSTRVVAADVGILKNRRNSCFALQIVYWFCLSILVFRRGTCGDRRRRGNNKSNRRQSQERFCFSRSSRVCRDERRGFSVSP